MLIFVWVDFIAPYSHWFKENCHNCIMLSINLTETELKTGYISSTLLLFLKTCIFLLILEIKSQNLLLFCSQDIYIWRKVTRLAKTICGECQATWRGAASWGYGELCPLELSHFLHSFLVNCEVKIL